MEIIITVDTEADNQWEYSEAVTTDNLDHVPRFQSLCEGYGLRPTYLCTFEVAESAKFESVLLPYHQRGAAEIGAHLHPWTNPPFGPAARADIDKDAYPAYPSELVLEDFSAKLGVLTDRIAGRVGRTPTSYRAGRWGLAPAHVPILEALGYTVDCSVTPLVSWAKHTGRHEGGPDFRAASSTPYFLDPTDVCRAGSSTLLEVPVTIVSSSETRKPMWFRPFPDMSAERLLKVYSTASQQQLPALEMMFHSSELMPGGSPYNLTEESIEQLYARFERVFAQLEADGCRGVTLSAFAESMRELC